jgi:hypothetical protein
MKVEDVAGGSFTPEKRRLDMTEDGHSAPKERQSVIDEAMESSSMKQILAVSFFATFIFPVPASAPRKNSDGGSKHCFD